MIQLKGTINNLSAQANAKQCNRKPTQATNDVLGTRTYYVFRYWDFRHRHIGCAHKSPPVYYYGPTVNDKPCPDKSYGYKYCVKFEDVIYPKLSEQGKRWLIQTKLNLQKYLEKGLIQKKYTSNNFPAYTMIYSKNNSLKDVELDNEWFMDFAFATHPDAYLDAGLLDLGLKDLRYIATTPEMKEFMDARTRKQVRLVAKKFIQKYASMGIFLSLMPFEVLDQAGEDVKKRVEGAAEKIFEEMITEIPKIIKQVAIERIKEIINSHRKDL